MQVVVEEGFDVVRSGAVGPLDADAIMFSDPYGELADDTGVHMALREVVLCSFFTERRHGPGVFLAPFWPARTRKWLRRLTVRRNCSLSQLSYGVLRTSVAQPILVR
jgi:hypothetical protein